MIRNKTEVYTAKGRIAEQKARQRERNVANTKTCPVCDGRGRRCWGSTRCAACRGTGRVDIRMSYQKAWAIVEQASIGRSVSRGGNYGYSSSRGYYSSGHKGDQRHQRYKK